MRKNVASQVVCGQMNARADGAPLTTSVTVYVLGDGGAQGAGGGTTTHEGQGCWSYVPTQAETNYNHIAFTFVHATGVNVTVNVYTTEPQTGDAYVRLGAPAGASVSADVAAVKTDTAAILLDTGTDGVVLPQAQADKVWSSATRTLTAFSTALALSVWDVLEAAIVTASSIGIKLKTNIDALISSRSTYAGGAVASVTADVGITQPGADKVWATAVRALTDKAGFSVGAGGIPVGGFAAGAITDAAIAVDAETAIANAVLAVVVESEGSITLKQAIDIVLSAVAGVTSAGGATLKTPNGIATRIAATINASNERTAMTLTPSA
jgi:hypothetical protein